MRSYRPILARRKWTILSAVLASAVVVGLGMLRTPPSYTATALLHLLPAGSADSTDAQRAYSRKLTSTYIALARSQLVEDQVEQSLHLTSLPDIEVEPIAETDLIELRVTAEDPVLAKEVANTVAAILVNQEEEAYAPVAILAKNMLEEEVARLEAELADLDRQYWDLVSQVSAPPERLAELNRELDQKERLYDELINSYGQARINNAMQENMLSIVQPATIPRRPIPATTLPARLLITTVAALIGGVALAIVLDQTDQRLFTSRDAEAVTRLRVIGRIPRLRSPEERLVGTRDPSPAEAFRQLRSSLLAAPTAGGSQVLLLTSAAPDEGKSTVVSNLAYFMAESGRRVVVVDADMRRPSQHDIFGVENEIGLSSVLNGEHRLGEAVRETGVPGVHLLPSGPLPPNPAELLSQPGRLAETLDELRARFDVVLLDSPPALAATDAAVISLLADRVLVVLRLARSEADAVAEVRSQFDDIGVPLSGVIVNLANRDAGASAYRYAQH